MPTGVRTGAFRQCLGCLYGGTRREQCFEIIRMPKLTHDRQRDASSSGPVPGNRPAASVPGSDAAFVYPVQLTCCALNQLPGFAPASAESVSNGATVLDPKPLTRTLQ